MTFSKVVSGMGGAPSGLLKSGTNFASKSGKDWVSYGGRRAALDPALTFLAPLNRDTQDDLGAADTFTRESDGLYLPYNGADWRIASDNVPRFENGQLLKEPAATNVFLNSASAATQSINLPLGEHTISVHGGGSVTSSDSGGVATGHGTATDGNPVVINVTTAGNILFTVSGAPDYVQVESGRVPTSPIITQGAAAVRAADALSYVAGVDVFNQSEGMALLTFRVPFDLADNIIENNSGLLSVNGLPNSLIYCRNLSNSNVLTLLSFTGTNTYTGPAIDVAENDVLYAAIRWTGGNSRQLGLRKNSEAWAWATPKLFTFDWAVDGTLNVGLDNRDPRYYENIQLYNEDKGTSWIEANYP